MDRLRQLVHEIHRRSLWQVVGIYLAGSWVALQVVREIALTLGLPDWFPPFAFALLVIGFPVVLATAFVQEGGPASPGSDVPLVDGAGREVGRRQGARGQGGRGPVDTARRLFTWRNALLGGGAAFALWGMVAAGWVLLHGAPGDRGPESILATEETQPAVAVLPFENLSASEENEFFARGMHEAILTNLSRVGDLTILSRTSVMRYEETDKDVRTIAGELGATAVVEGSVQRSGDEIRVTAQLIDARTDAHLWAESYDRTLEDVFAVQSDVAQKVSDALEATLTPGEQRRIEQQPTESLTAYDLYLKGREAYHGYSRPDNDEAVRLFHEAIAADSAFALAWAGLANAYGLRVHSYGQSSAWADSAVAVGRRSVELDPELDEGHKALAVAHFVRGNLEWSLEEGRRAVELNPNHHGAMNNIGVLSTYLGRHDEAVSWYRRAFRLQPNSPITRANMVWGFLHLGDTATAGGWLEEAEILNPEHSITLRAASGLQLARGEPRRALETALRRTELHPEDPGAWLDAARFALMAREYEPAVRLARRALELNPAGAVIQDKPARSVLGYGLLELGETEEGRAELRDVLEQAGRELDRGSEFPQLPWEIGTVHAALGDREEALAWLERGHDAGFPWLYTHVRHDPMLDPLRDEPRFRRIVADLEDDVAAMRERVVREEREAGIR